MSKSQSIQPDILEDLFKEISNRQPSEKGYGLVNALNTAASVYKRVLEGHNKNILAFFHAEKGYGNPSEDMLSHYNYRGSEVGDRRVLKRLVADTGLPSLAKALNGESNSQVLNNHINFPADKEKHQDLLFVILNGMDDKVVFHSASVPQLCIAHQFNKALTESNYALSTDEKSALETVSALFKRTEPMYFASKGPSGTEVIIDYEKHETASMIIKAALKELDSVKLYLENSSAPAKLTQSSTNSALEQQQNIQKLG